MYMCRTLIVLCVLNLILFTFSVLVEIVKPFFKKNDENRKDKNRKVSSFFSRLSAVSANIVAILSLSLGLHSYVRDVPPPNIYPLNNEVSAYMNKREVEVSFGEEKWYETYYSLDGTDPKEGTRYEKPFVITGETTVAARNRYLGNWSPISKSYFNIAKGFDETHFEEVDLESIDYIIKCDVRKAGEKEFKNCVCANVGDRLEFQTEYINCNTNGKNQENVMIKAILPSNLKYVEGTTKLYSVLYPEGGTLTPDGDIFSRGVNIGECTPDSNAFIRFTVEVVDDSLVEGSNTLVAWGQGGVETVTIQDYASVIVEK